MTPWAWNWERGGGGVYAPFFFARHKSDEWQKGSLYRSKSAVVDRPPPLPSPFRTTVGAVVVYTMIEGSLRSESFREGTPDLEPAMASSSVHQPQQQQTNHQQQLYNSHQPKNLQQHQQHQHEAHQQQPHCSSAESSPHCNSTSASRAAAAAATSYGKMEPQTDDFPAGLRILVVDDDLICLAILQKMLQHCSYQGVFFFSVLHICSSTLWCICFVVFPILLYNSFLQPVSELGEHNHTFWPCRKPWHFSVLCCE